jgi:hypothetical protein
MTKNKMQTENKLYEEHKFGPRCLIRLLALPEDWNHKPLHFSNLTHEEMSGVYGDMTAFNAVNEGLTYGGPGKEREWGRWKSTEEGDFDWVKDDLEMRYTYCAHVAEHYLECSRALRKVWAFIKNREHGPLPVGVRFWEIDYQEAIDALKKRAFDMWSIKRMENVIKMAEKI